MTLTVVIPNGQTQGTALPGAAEKILRDNTNKGLFLNYQTGASFSATADFVISWCVSLN